MNNIKAVTGGVCAPQGFLAAGIHCGIKKNKKDLALIYSEVPCKAVAMYTSNKVKAAPIYVTMDHLKDGLAQAVIVNSGNANACAHNGMENALKMAESAALNLGLKPSDLIVASTGVIGVPLPIEKIEEKMPELVKQLSKDGGSDVAEAIMTTDTFKKEYSVSFELKGKTVKIGGTSKGSGMIHPNMATTLSFITTDVDIDEKLLNKAFSCCVKKSFNRISVDGDTSTNDMACIMASGLAGNPRIEDEDGDYDIFVKALLEVCVHLARELARDGEGATRLITCTVKNSQTEEKAEVIAKTVISSSLLKTAIFGADANWGRVLCAMGYSGADFDYEKVDIYFSSKSGEIAVCRNGRGVDFDETLARRILSEGEIDIIVDLKEGENIAAAWGCDLSYEYVRINGEYGT